MIWLRFTLKIEEFIKGEMLDILKQSLLLLMFPGPNRYLAELVDGHLVLVVEPPEACLVQRDLLRVLGLGRLRAQHHRTRLLYTTKTYTVFQKILCFRI